MSQKENNKSIDDFKFLIGKKVIKNSQKPFKSTFKINTVKDVIIHPIKGNPAFTFYEDDSFVECYICKEV